MKYKSLLVAGVFLASAVAMPALADHSTPHTIEQLQAQIATLIQQIKALQTQQGQGETFCHTFNVNLGFGSRGSEVAALQQALENEGLSVLTDIELGPNSVFNEAIASAVTGFQQKYRDEILTPVGLKYGTGYVGPSTRKKLNQLYGCGDGGPPPIIPPIPPPPPPPPPPIPQIPPVTVLSPNGGETWAQGSQQVIAWKSTTQESFFARINLTGASYSLIFSQTPNDGSESWLVPSTIPTGNYRISVSLCRSNNDCFWNDFSDAPFSIVSSNTGTNQNLDINSDGNIDGNDSNLLADIVMGNATCPAGKNCNVNNDGAIDAKDVLEYWFVNTPYDLNDDGAVTSRDNVYLVNVINGFSTCPSGKKCDTNGDGKINVYDLTALNKDNASESCVVPSTLNPSGSITAPADGKINLSWSSVPDAAYYVVRLDDGTYDRFNDSRYQRCMPGGSPHYYCQNGIVGTSVTGIPVKPGRTYKYWVAPIYYPARNDCPLKSRTITVSGGTVNIPSITVLSPNGGEIYRMGSTQTIKWNAQNLAGSLSNIYLLEGDNRIKILATNISTSQGFYDWTVPVIEAATNFRINITTSQEGVWDNSDAPFSIVSNTNIGIPNPQLSYIGAEDYIDAFNNPYTRYGLSVTNWSAYPNELFIPAPDLPACGLNNNASRTWVNIYNAETNAYLYGFCGFTSPQLLTSLWFGIPRGSTPLPSVYITINDRKTGAVYRSNNASISATTTGASIKVISPNGGEIFNIGTTSSITWQWKNGTAQNFTIILNDTVGNSELIASNVPANGASPNSFAWNVKTFMTSSQYTIEVCGQFTSGDYICDKSDSPFSVQAPFIRVTYPQANATLTQNQPYTITWDAAGIASEITLKLMKNNQIFQTIGTAGSLQRTYSWTPTSAVGTGTNIFRVYIGGTTAGGQIKTNLGSTFSIVAPTAQTSVKIKNVRSQKCLDIRPSDEYVIQNTCNSLSNTQNWQFVQSSGAYLIKSVASGKCVDIKNANYSNETRLIAFGCHGGLNQQWKFVHASSSSQITSVPSGKNIDIPNASTADGAEAQIYSAHGGLNQQFTFEGLPAGTVLGASTSIYNPDSSLIADLKVSRPDLGIYNSDGPVSLPMAGSVTLEWNAPGATSCIIDGTNFGLLPASGSRQSTTITGKTNFFLLCTNRVDYVGDEVVVDINSSKGVVLGASTAQNANASLLAALVVSVDELLNAISQLLSQLGQ